MRKIVCLSSADWYPTPTRKQQVMTRLHDAEVLYFDPPVTWIAPLKDKSTRPRLTLYRKTQEKPQENITVCALPPVLPFGNKYRCINRLNQRRQARFIRRKMRQYGFEDALLWSYLPWHCDLVPRLPHSGAVYDCVDRHSGYAGFINPDVVNAMEAELCRECTGVFSTAQGLHETLSGYNPRAKMIPNGSNYELFSKAQAPLPVPEELSGCKGPVIGFVGMLAEWVDREMLLRLAKDRPDYTLAFVGKTLPGAALGELATLPNVIFCGLKPQKELPRYIARFDVCLNLFRAGALSKDVSPLKFYEYLATGKPIVSTPQPEQVLAFRDAVVIASGVDDIAQKVDEALHDTPERREKRLAYAKTCTWEARVEQIEKTLEEWGV